MSKILAIIPSRYNSTRLPGKPLLDIGGKTMIERVYTSVLKSNLLTKVVVATDDDRILKEVVRFGGEAVITSADHKSGTSRVFEAAKMFPDYNLILNIQGDQPFVNSRHIDELCRLLCKHGGETCVVTPVLKITKSDDVFDSSISKVILGAGKRAIFFSRQAIPYARDKNKLLWHKRFDYWKHVGIYGYTSSSIDKISSLPVSNLEEVEALEQLGWLYNNIPIYTTEVSGESISVDTEDDWKVAINMANGKLD